MEEKNRNGHGKEEDKKPAKKTPFYQTEFTGVVGVGG